MTPICPRQETTIFPPTLPPDYGVESSRTLALADGSSDDVEMSDVDDDSDLLSVGDDEVAVN